MPNCGGHRPMAMRRGDGKMRLPDSLLMRLEPLRRHFAVWRAAWSLEKLRPKLIPRTADELTFLPAAIEIIETPASPLGRGTVWMVMAMFSMALAWSCLGKVDIHATAQGRVIPGGKTKTVAALEAATVAAIHVADGDHVTEGQALIELDPAGPGADVTRLRREWQEQTVTAARLKALLAGQTDMVVTVAIPPDLVASHRAQLLQKLADHAATMAALRRDQEQREAEMRGTEADILRLEQTVPLLAERASAKAKLSEEGYVSRTEYLQIQQEHIDRQQQLAQARHKLTEMEAAIGSVRERLAQAEAQFRSESYAQMADAEQKAASLGQDLAKAEDRQRLYKLTGPVSGTVQQLAVHAPGAVVSQAQPLLLIVPDNEGIAIEAALPNKDA